MKEFLLSDEFREYRKRMIEEIVAYVTPDILNPTGEKLPVLSGALSMAGKLIRLPIKMTKDKAVRLLLQSQYVEDIKRFELSFVRVFLDADIEQEDL